MLQRNKSLIGTIIANEWLCAEYEAIRKEHNAGHEAVIELLLQADADVNSCDSEAYVYTPLHMAVDTNQPRLVERLLREGADPNIQVNGGTPLMWVCARGNADIVLLLLKAQADVNQRVDGDGDTALHMACFHNHIRIVKKLFEFGCKIDMLGAGDRIPLHAACENEARQVVEYLIEHATVIMQPDASGKTSFDIATEIGQMGHTQLVQFLNGTLARMSFKVFTVHD